MDVSEIAYLALLAAVGAGRLAEMRVSRRNQRRMLAAGSARVREAGFFWMVALHAGVLMGAGVEVVALRRPLIPALAMAMTALFLLANALRWWVIRTLGGRWNVQVVDSPKLGVVTKGPYRWVRHPNYAAVFVELIALPLIHTAWITALCAAAGQIWVLRARLAVEEPVLLANPAYREAMGGKPRFLPRVL